MPVPSHSKWLWHSDAFGPRRSGRMEQAMLVPMKYILDEAYEGGYGVPAVPGFNEIQVRATLEAAADANSPVIFLTGNGDAPEWNHAMIRKFADDIDLPVASCLDHSLTFEDCMLGIRTGLSAIMADRSMLPYEKNAAESARLAKIAHSVGVSIEAELGHVGQGDNYAVDGVSALTDPQEARSFLEETGVDGLAVAIGTAHGLYSGTPRLDFGRLAEINAAVGIPLALHGGSGSGDENIHRACTMGIAKVNIVTDILLATDKAAKAYDFVKGSGGHLFFPALSKAIREAVARTFQITGSAGKGKPVARENLSGNLYFNTEEK